MDIDYMGQMLGQQAYEQASTGAEPSMQQVPSEEGAMSDAEYQEFKASMADQPLVDESFDSRMSHGWDNTIGALESVMIKGVSSLPDQVADAKSGSILSSINAASTVLALYGMSALGSQRADDAIKFIDNDLDALRNMTFDEREQAIVDIGSSRVADYYAGVDEGGFGGFVGSLGKELATDPISAMLPMAKTFKMGAALGASEAAAAETLRQSLGEGNYDLGTIVAYTTAGAVLGGVIAKGGKTLSDWLGNKVRDGSPVDEEAVRDFFKANKLDTDGLTYKSLADEINGNYSLSESSKLNIAVKDANSLTAGADIERSAEELLEVLANEPARAKLLRGLINTEIPGGPVTAMQRENLDGWKRAVVDKDGNVSVRWAEGESPFKAGKNSFGTTTLDDAYRTMPPEAPEKLYKAFKDLDESIPTDPNGGVTQAFREAVGEIPVSSKIDSETSKEAVSKAIARKEVPVSSPVGRKMYAEVGKAVDFSKPVSVTDAEKLVKAIDYSEWAMTPSSWLNKIGPVGQEFSERLRRGFEDTAMSVSESIHGVQSILSSATKKSGLEEEAFRLAVTREIRKKGSSKNPTVKTTAAFLQRKMQRVLNDAHKAGIISKSDLEKYTKISKEEGWFPRIYDTQKLSTDTGKKAWVEAMTSYNFSEEAANKAAKSINGEKFRRLDGITKQADGSYRVDRSFAMRALDRKLNSAVETSTNEIGKEGAKVKRSSHLEHERSIDLPDDLLEDFLINDPEHALERYFLDSYRRISFARYFGKNDEFAATAAKSVNTATGKKDIGQHMLRIYAHAVRDASDTSVKNSMRFMTQPNAVQSAMMKINTVQTVKLIMAQLLNITQATVNGLTMSTKMTGSYRSAVKSYLKAVGELVKDPMGSHEYAVRIGAANQQTIMQISGEMGDGLQRFQKAWLKYTGYQAIESLQRTLAANMGKAQVEDIVANKIKLLSDIKKRGPGSELVAKLKKLDSQLEDLGVRTDIDPSQITVKEMNRAAQRFSNMVNFVRDADQLPLKWQTPYGTFFTKFKSFALWQGKFLYHNVAAPAVQYVKTGGKEGSFKPLLAFAATSQLAIPTTMAREWIKAEAKGEPYRVPDVTKFEEGLKLSFNAAANVGLLGLWANTLVQTGEYGPQMAAANILGPGFGTVTEVAARGYMAAGQLGKGVIDESRGRDGSAEFKEAARQAGLGASAFLPPGIKEKVKKDYLDKPTYSY